MTIQKEIINIGMAVLKRNGRPAFTDSMFFPVAIANDNKYYRFYPILEDNEYSGCVGSDEIKNFDANYKFRQFKDYTKEIAEFII